MGRPAASIQNKILGICFAKTMCKATENKMDLVARSGPYAIFQAIKEIFPLCIREETFFRDGLNEVQLNKALQNSGFKRVRDRRAHAIKRTEDPTGAGMYLFSNLKWRNPENLVDRHDLVSGWNAICQRFPMVAQRCDAEKFLSIVGKFQKTWQPNAARMSNRANFEMEDEPHEAGSPHSMPHMQAEAAKQSTSAEHAAAAQLLMGQDPFASALGNQQQLPQAFQDLLRLQLELAKAQTLSLIQAQQAQAQTACLGLLPPIAMPNTSPILPPVQPNFFPPANLAPLTPQMDVEAVKKTAGGRMSPLEALRQGTSSSFTGMQDREMRSSANAFSDSELRLNMNSLVSQ